MAGTPHGNNTPRRGRGAPRQPFRKWLWLRNHPRRAEIVALVLSARGRVNASGASTAPLLPSELKDFNLTTRQLDALRHDALGVRARLANQSWRTIALLAKPERSHEGWRTVVRLYTEYSDDLFDAPAAS